jgi:CoA-transferase family III
MPHPQARAGPGWRSGYAQEAAKGRPAAGQRPTITAARQAAAPRASAYLGPAASESAPITGEPIGVLPTRGLDPAKLVQEHPRLIVCSISGFGQYGPLHMQAAYDTVIQAISGIMDATGQPDGGPTRVGTFISDILGLAG